VRRVPLFTQWQSAPGAPGKPLPSLSAEALRVAQGASNHMLRTSEAGLQDVRIGQLTIPTNHRGEMWLHYTLAEPSRYVSAVDVLQGKVPREQLDGNIVLLGTSAAGLMDLRFNPMGRLMPGVEAHAQALEQVLLGHYLERPAWASGVEAAALVLGALAAGLVALWAPAWASAAFTLVLLGGLLGGAWHLFTAQRILLDVASPTLAVLASFGLTSGIHHFISERQQRWVKEAFSRYVSPNRVAYLVDHPEQLQLGGKRQTCSFVFTDLAGFTTLMEKGDPAEAVRLLNEYLDGMVSIAFAHEATLDRIVGDAVVLLFSAPVPQPDHQQRALNCALAMDAFATEYAARVNASGVAWGHTRIGVHSGEVIVGNFGGKTVFDYRALGDPINTAARLESVNKHFGTRMCVSQQILDGCTDAAVRPVGRLVLKGKSRAIHVFEPLQTTDTAVCASPAAYQAAFDLLVPGDRQDSAAAMAAFEALSQQHPQDPLVQLHLKQLRSGGTDDLIVMADK
jgi:adenylate cyclase